MPGAQLAQRPGNRVVILVAVARQHGGGQVRERERVEAPHGPVTEEEAGKQGRAGYERYFLRVFGPGPTRIGVSSAHSPPAVSTSARISMFAARTAIAARANRRVGEPVRRPCAGQGPDDPGAPLDRDVVHDQQEHAPGLQVRPVDHGAGLPGPGRGRGGMGLPAAALNRVPVVLGDRRGDRRRVDELARRDHPEVARVREIPAAGTFPLREQRLPVVRILAPRQMRAGSAGLPALLVFPSPRFGPGSGTFLPGRSSADGGIPEFPEFRDTARSGFANRSDRSVTRAVSSAFRVSRISITTP
jgi:hypothetical protein